MADCFVLYKILLTIYIQQSSIFVKKQKDSNL